MKSAENAMDSLQTKSTQRLTLFLLLSLFIACQASANHPVSPDYIPGVPTLDASGLIDLAASTPGLRIIDSRITSDRRHGYIEGSVNLPDTQTTCDTLAGIIKDKMSPVLFYCNGPKCGRSAKAVSMAQHCGYKHIYWYRGGMEAWMNEGYPVIRD